MRAVWLKEFGGPEVLLPGEAPDPAAGAGEALIAVTYANITFVETQMRAGGGPGPGRPQLPLIPGNGVGGVVLAVGEGVDGDLVGARVATSLGGSGGYAERVTVAASAPFDVPDAVALDEAVALLADGRTATALIHAAGVREGDRVLVEAAAGGVGSLLVQLARNAGAHVVAVAGGARKVALAADLGAQHAFDNSSPDWADRVRDAVGAVDVVFDGVGGEIGATAYSLLDGGGRFLSYGLASGAWTSVSEKDAAARGVTVRRGPLGTPEELRGFTQSVLEAAAAGHVKPVVGQRFPLEQAADAHHAIESRTTVGKTLLVV
ncbi:MAG TPA: zinc-binding dehydrogenase [Amycolatopsis sp.]|nr:zinc-binding dehydrogenase [Amycolatopsis sp.]